MKVGLIIRIVLLSTVFQVSSTIQTKLSNYDDYFDFEPEIKDAEDSLNTAQRTNHLFLNSDRSDVTLGESPPTRTSPRETTECIMEPLSTTMTPAKEPDKPIDAQQLLTPPPPTLPSNLSPSINKPDQIATNTDDVDDKGQQLKLLVQLLSIAQARVQLEAGEIKKAQAVANSAQLSLEDAANHVRTMTANLQNAQQEVASAAIRAQTAQLKLAAHDQLLFAARQDVDALSTQIVGLQAADSITQPKSTVDLTDLLEKLKQPLQEADKPTPVPALFQYSTQATNQQQNRNLQHYRHAPDYQHFYYN